ncbi:MAG: ATPase, T2SS/T4P/T4SS family [Halanaeroarchaeum sp.]
MAIDDADEGLGTPSGNEGEQTPPDRGAAVGEYTWRDYLEEHDLADEVGSLYTGRGEDGERILDWEAVSFDPVDHLGFHPTETTDELTEGGRRAKALQAIFDDYLDPTTTPVVKGEYTWEHYKQEYYYEDDGSRPRDEEGDIIRFDEAEHLGFDPDGLEGALSFGEDVAGALAAVVDERTVDVSPDLDEDAFFSTVDGETTIVNRYDLEKAVTMEKKRHFREVERYWVNKPYAFVVIFHSEKENEKKYYLVEPHLTPIETDLQEFLTEKLRTAIKYAKEDVVVEGSEGERRDVIERETRELLRRYDLYSGPVTQQRGTVERLIDSVVADGGDYTDRAADFLEAQGWYRPPTRSEDLAIEGLSVRPEPVLIEEDSSDLTQYQVEKLLYVLKRNFIGYERIDGIKHDINVEDISVDGYNSPVFVYHTDYEQLITNVEHGKQQLDDFVVKLAQRSGKGISKRQPQVDATLPDGSRAQLTLGEEVSDHGTNYTIRQFKEIPFTPVDLINWKTFSLREMAFLWLCIENNKSLMFAGGTASGKTTSLNAVSLFVPSNAKIVSIEDTREVELPQRNWIASVTRPSFGEDDRGDIDEFDLLEAALRQRPDYIIMGEVRGEEGRTLFQVMSTGHTTYTTFHADNVSEVIKRFTTEPINVSKTLFTALDLISIQASTRVRGKKVRRSREITEIRRYDAENDEINVNDVFQWRPETDTYRRTAESTTLEEIKFDRGWSDEELDRQMRERQAIIAYLIVNGLNTYTEVAATIQAYITDSETILTLIANDELEAALADLRQMESVLIDVDEEKEEMVPRPDPDEETLAQAKEILHDADQDLFEDYRGASAPDISDVLEIQQEGDVVADATPEEIRDDPEPHGGTVADERADDGTETSADGTADTTPTDRHGTEASAEEDEWVGFGEDDEDSFAMRRFGDFKSEAEMEDEGAVDDPATTDSTSEVDHGSGDTADDAPFEVEDDRTGDADTDDRDGPSTGADRFREDDEE